MRFLFKHILFLLILTSSQVISFEKPRLFIDRSFISFDYLREALPYLNYVRDRRQADIYLMVTRQQTGTGGEEYTLTLTGQKKFTGVNDTLIYYTTSFDTDESERDNFVKTLKRGLLKFIVQTDLINAFDIVYLGQDTVSAPIDDPWNYWVSRIRLSGDIGGETLIKSHEFFGSLRVDRITENWKIRFDTQFNYEQETYEFEGEKSSSIDRRQEFNSTVVKSVSNHFSVGMFAHASSSTYQNTASLYNAQLAVEYNFYPYTSSTYKSLTISYSLGINRYNYRETTIYDKKEEFVPAQRLEMEIEFTQNWGGIDGRIRYGSHLSNFSRNRIESRGWVSVNLLEGFSIDLGGGYSRINDQISISKQEVSIEELLLGRKELATEYSYWGSIGLSYTFGSIYNNTVNPRF